MTLTGMNDDERRAAMRRLAVPLTELMRCAEGRLLPILLAGNSPIRALLHRMADTAEDAVCEAASVLTGALQTDAHEAMDQLLLCADEELVRLAFLCGRLGAGRVLRGLEAACAVHVRELEALTDAEVMPQPAALHGMAEDVLRGRMLTALHGCMKEDDACGR